MIKYILKGHNLHHEVQSMIQVFYPNVHYIQTEQIQPLGLTIISIIENNICTAILYEDNIKIDESSIKMEYDIKYNDEKKEIKRFIKTAIYMLLTKVTKKEISWGILTGIRPAKNVNELWDKGATDEEIVQILTKKYFAQKDKIELAMQVAKVERKILSTNDKNTISLYIGIPFCPTTCLYCSFTSYPLYIHKNKVDNYMKALIKEIEYTSKYANKYKIESIYIGGGTPTSLNENQLELLLSNIYKYFDLSTLKEFTIEAGRPDTITKEKLKIMKNYKANRISINPQTMVQKTLDIIGRKHTVEDTKNAFYMARDLGYNNINMDIILGLPEETLEDVEITMKEIFNLNPDSLTVHTLAIKRASALKQNSSYQIIDRKVFEKILKSILCYADKFNMYPYYMYRQKNMVGNFENIGYCKSSKESFYNIKIMEEKQTILSMGAGATTKVVNENNKIERTFNVKSLDDYINRIDEMIKRKEDFFSVNNI